MDTIIAVLGRESFNLYITLITIVEIDMRNIYRANPYTFYVFVIKW